MKKYLYFSVLLSFFIISCADSSTVVYDYNNEDSTIGLTVNPSNTLVFTSEDVDKAKVFELSIDTNEITLLGLDDASSDYNGGKFANDPKFDVITCLDSNANGYLCTISIKMNNTATEGDSGSIRLRFIYNNDNQAKPNSYKYHKLNFTYQKSN